MVFFKPVLLGKINCILGKVCVLPSPFPGRAASSVHVRLHVVQHVGQRVLNDSSPAHIAHLAGKNTRVKTQVARDLRCSEGSQH